MNNKYFKWTVSSLVISCLPTLAAAEDAPTLVATDTVFILNSLLFLVGGFLVFWMAAGFAMLEAGMVRSKNVTMQLTKNVALFSLAAVFYYLLGYNLMYPLGTWSMEGILSGVWSVAILEAVGIGRDAADDYGYASTGSDFFFQLMFCAATASIVSGALAERIKLWPFLIFTILLTAVIYPIQASWKWGGGFLDGMGFLDFAGSTAGMSNYVKDNQPGKVIMVTECSMSDNVAIENPNVEFIRPCNLCPHMKRISLKKIYDAIRFNQYQIQVDKAIIDKARLSIDRMLEIGRSS